MAYFMELADMVSRMSYSNIKLARSLAERDSLMASLQKTHGELEQRVAERTVELAATVEALRSEVTVRERAEESLRRLNRLYSVLSETDQAIVRATDRDSLFRDFCRIAVENGGFLLSWVGLVGEESGRIRMVAASGATAYLDDIRISVKKEPTGLGPTGISIREGTYCICNDFQNDPRTLPWHEQGLAHGIRASASVALKEEGSVVGALTLYADEKDFFDEQHVALLQQMGADISFALDNLKREVRRREAEQALREKEQLLMQQSRQAALGEMIGNIAHQWRQPLNALGLTIQELALANECGVFTVELLDANVASAMEIILHMSQTIDDFRNFFQPDKEKSWFRVNQILMKTISLIEANFREHRIGIEIAPMDDLEVNGFPNEYSQVLLNILMNAQDAFLGKKGSGDARIIVRAWREEGRAVVTIADNAGGIAENIMDKIFDPYFTTKEQGLGTGIGLFMAKTIIEKNMGGRITAHNVGDGAEFRIEV
jgi:C4-dicarboxylate-specific signal transduction histidine kinase